MSWSSLPPGRRAAARATLLFTVILIVAVIWNVTDETTGVVLRGADLLMAGGAAAIYAGIMFVVDSRLAKRDR